MAIVTPANHVLVAAYGSNLNPAQIHDRIGAATVFGVGRLMDHRLTFAGHSQRQAGPVATVVPHTRSTVPVVLYAVDKAQLKILDAYEGVKEGSYRRETVRVDTNLGEVKAQVYVHNSPPSGAPSEMYLRRVRDGYAAFNLDQKALDAAVRRAQPKPKKAAKKKPAAKK